MPNPLIFFIVVIVIDLVLKSIRDKRKLEEARQKKMGEVKAKNFVKPEKENRPIRELRKILEDELQREKEKNLVEKPKETMETIEKRKTRKDLIREQRQKIEKNSELEKMKRRKEERERQMEVSRHEYKTPIKQSLIAKTEEDKKEFKEDVLKGIIFSEILGKPKSLKR